MHYQIMTMHYAPKLENFEVKNVEKMLRDNPIGASQSSKMWLKRKMILNGSILVPKCSYFKNDSESVLHFNVTIFRNYFNSGIETSINASHWNYWKRIWFILYLNLRTTVEATKSSEGKRPVCLKIIPGILGISSYVIALFASSYSLYLRSLVN